MSKFRKIYGTEPMHIHNHKNIYVPSFMSYSAVVSLSTIWVLWRLCHRWCKSLSKSHFLQLPDIEDRKYTLWNPRTLWIGEYIKYNIIYKVLCIKTSASIWGEYTERTEVVSRAQSSRVRPASLLSTLQDTAEEKHGEERRMSTEVILGGKKPNPTLICIWCVIYMSILNTWTIFVRDSLTAEILVINVYASNGEETLEKYQKEQKVRAAVSLLRTVSIYENCLAILNLPAGRKLVQNNFRMEISHPYQCCAVMPCYLILHSYYI